MIQRIQSVLLFLAFLVNGGVFFNALYRHAVQDPSQWIGITFASILAVATLLPLICIFLYHNRQNQLRWITVGLLLNVVMIGFGVGLFISMGGFGPFLWDEAVGLALLLAGLLLQLYARKKVKDDIELVRSMDRIR